MRCKAGSSSTTRTQTWRSAPPRRPTLLDDVSPMLASSLLTLLAPCKRGHRITCLVLMFLFAATFVAAAQPLASQSRTSQEPITPIPAPPVQDSGRQALGEQLFHDPRLSHDNTRSCGSCHDMRT